jgi:hypothetical protein
MEHYLHNENAHPEWSPGVPNITDLIGRHRVVLAEARADHPAVLHILDPIWADAYLKRLGRSRTLTPVMRARIASCIAVGRLADAEQDLSRYEELVQRWPGGLVPAGLGWLRGQLAEARGEAREAQREYARDLADHGLADFPMQLGQLLHTSGRLELALRTAARPWTA